MPFLPVSGGEGSVDFMQWEGEALTINGNKESKGIGGKKIKVELIEAPHQEATPGRH